jgi:hypothetical protein
MRILLILPVLALLAASGCVHNCCGHGMGGGLFAKRPQAPCCPQQVQTVQAVQAVPCCPQTVCCDPCAGMGVSGPVTTTSMSPVMGGPAMPTVPCCQ